MISSQNPSSSLLSSSPPLRPLLLLLFLAGWMHQVERNNQSFKTELAIQFWVVPLSFNCQDDWSMLILLYINNCPTRCNTKQSIYYSASSLYMFRVSITPIIRSTQNCNYSLRYCAATSLQRGQAWPHWRKEAAQKIWPVPEGVVTVLCTPDDGCGWHPKHVQWTCRRINRLLCVASRWTIIDIDQRCTEP